MSQIGTVESLSRTMSTTSGNTLEMQRYEGYIYTYMYMYQVNGVYHNDRDMVKAMQDPEAGIKLTEIGLKHGKGITKYFTGTHYTEFH